jgi:hypothetical protein
MEAVDGELDPWAEYEELADDYDQLKAEVELLRAAVTRVRELCTQVGAGPFPGLAVYVQDVLDALDGET